MLNCQEDKEKDQMSMEGLSSFFELFDSQATRLDTMLYENEKEMKQTREQLTTIQMNLNKLTSDKKASKQSK